MAALTCLPELDRAEQAQLCTEMFAGRLDPALVLAGQVSPDYLAAGHRRLLASGEPARQADRIAQRCGLLRATMLFRGHAGYPLRLEDLDDPPLVLYARGNMAALAHDLRSVAVVGTRRPSSLGLALTRAVARELAAGGLVIVSGMALGTDAAAHEAALAAGGLTVGVLASGVDEPTPRSNAALGGRIVRHGVLVSEQPPGTPVRAWSFAARNRIIAALADATAVMEAGLRSGTRITADRAQQLDRPVFALEGRPGDEVTAGSVELLDLGGVKPFRSVGELIRRLGSRGIHVAATPHEASWQLGPDLLDFAHALAAMLPSSVDTVLRRLGAAANLSTVLGSIALLRLHGVLHEDEAGILRLVTTLPER